MAYLARRGRDDNKQGFRPLVVPQAGVLSDSTQLR